MKRCCETCRFFEKGTLAGSGWCRHPERVEAQSDLVLVRASQLTCRKGWDKDFWEPISLNGRTVDRIPRGAQLGPVPPASPEDIDAIIKAGKTADERAAASGAIEEDRVVGAAPSPLTHVPKSLITKHLPPTSDQSEAASAAHEGQNAREKILIAKEEVARKRISNRIRPSVEPLPSAATPPAPSSAGADDTGAVDSITTEPQTVPENTVETVADDNTESMQDIQANARDGRLPLPFEVRTGTDEWEDEPLVPTIPPTFDHWNYPTERQTPFLWLVHGVNSKRTEAPMVDGSPVPGGLSIDVVAQSNTEIESQPFELPPPVDTTFRPPARPAREKPRARRQRQSFTFRTRWADARESPRRREQASPPAWSDAPQWADEPMAAEESIWSVEANPDDAILPALDDFEAGIPLVHLDEPVVPAKNAQGISDWDQAAEPAWTGQMAQPAAFEDFRFDEDRELRLPALGWASQEEPGASSTEDVVVSGNGFGPIVYDPEVDEYVLAPEVPRMCRTCAAFRPAEDGERGWCSNGWAFNNRLLVSAWDVPCQTSFGNWWIPNDDNWNDGVLERLNAPAPLFDLLMAQRVPPRREKPGPKKRWS